MPATRSGASDPSGSFHASNVPEWVPLITRNKNADVYPVPHSLSSSPRSRKIIPPELVLDATSLSAGYSEERPQYEFASLRNDADSNDEDGLFVVDSDAFRKLVRGGRMLKGFGSRGRVVLRRTKSTGRGRFFPLQKPGTAKSLDEWMMRLANPETDIAELAREVPLGPAIARAVGKVLNLMWEKNVPVQRATWFIRVAVLNDCFKLMRPDRPVPSPKLSWTARLAGFLKSEWERLKKNRTIANDAEEVRKEMNFLKYILRIARWQTDEGLLDVDTWLQKILEILHLDLVGKDSSNDSRSIVLHAVELSLFEIMASRKYLLELIQIAVKFLQQATPKDTKANSNVTQPENSLKEKANSKSLITQTQRLVRILAACVNSVMSESSVEVNPLPSPVHDVEWLLSAANDLLSSESEELVSAKSHVRPYTRHLEIHRSLSALHQHGDVTSILSILPRETRKAATMVTRWALQHCMRTPHATLSAAYVLVTLSRRDSSLLPGNDIAIADAQVPFKYHRDIWYALKDCDHTQGNVASISKLLAHFSSRSLLDIKTMVSDVGTLLQHVLAEGGPERAQKDYLALRYCSQYILHISRVCGKRANDLTRSLYRRLQSNFPEIAALLSVPGSLVKLPTLQSPSTAYTEARELLKAGSPGRVLEVSRNVRELYCRSQCSEKSSERRLRLLATVTFLLVTGCPDEAIRCLLFETGQGDDRPEETCYIASSMWSAVTASGARKGIDSALRYRKGKKNVRYQRLESLRETLQSTGHLDKGLLDDREYRFSLGEIIGDVVLPVLKELKRSEGTDNIRGKALEDLSRLLDDPAYTPFGPFLSSRRVAELMRLEHIQKLQPYLTSILSHGDPVLGSILGKDVTAIVFPPLADCVTRKNVTDAELVLGAMLTESPLLHSSASVGDLQSPTQEHLANCAKELMLSLDDIVSRGSSEEAAFLAGILEKVVSDPVHRAHCLCACVQKAAERLKERLEVPEKEDDKSTPQYHTPWLSFLALMDSHFFSENENIKERVSLEIFASIEDAAAEVRKSAAGILRHIADQGMRKKSSFELETVVGALKIALYFGAESSLSEKESETIATTLGQLTKSPQLIEMMYFSDDPRDARKTSICVENLVGTLQALKRCSVPESRKMVASVFLRNCAESVVDGRNESQQLNAQKHSFNGVLGGAQLEREGRGIRTPVTACNEKGPTDNWHLLEGFGKYPDQQAVLDPESFGIQANSTESFIPPPIRVKRTYSAFAALVR